MTEEGFTDCPDCGREYTTQFAAYSEVLDGYGTHTEYYARDKKCPGCAGEADCDWCDSTEAKTIIIDKKVEGDLCAGCAAEAEKESA